MNNQSLSKIWIIVIVLILAVGVILAWQYLGAPKEEVKPLEEIKLTKQGIIDYTIENIAKISPIQIETGKKWKVKYIGYTSDEDAYVEYTNGVSRKILVSYMKGSIEHKVNAVYELTLSEKNKGIDWKLVEGEDPEKRKPIIYEWDSGDTVDIEVYFVDREMMIIGDYENLVKPFTRTVPDRPAIARTAIEELLKGPTPEETAQGYSTSILLKWNVKLLSLEIKEGTAFVDFSEELKSYGGGSAWVIAISQQIQKTLLQFADVDRVELFIEGVPAIESLQP